MSKLPKLLCVDDQPINIQILHQIFSVDHEMFMAMDGAQALVLCEQIMPDLILLDVMMPEMNGHEVCRRLKQSPVTADIPVIFVTAQTNIDDEAAGLQEGAVDFITRPFNASVVRARVQTHLQLHRLKENLEAKVLARTHELELAQQRLQDSQEKLTASEAKATISTLIASVSHELGTPIGTSLMAATSFDENATRFKNKYEAGLIKRSDVGNYVNELTEISSIIQRNLLRASELLSNLRQVSADQASEQRRTFDLAETIKEIIDTIGPSIKRKPHRIELAIPPDIIMDSQPGSLGQIVINLINNAYLHAFENRSSGLLKIEAQLIGQTVRLSFIDDGEGIPEENLLKLFEPFFSTKIGHGGTGLGMAIVHNVVTKMLGGSIKVDSAVGAGTRFDITLPLIMPEKKLDH